MIRHFVILVDSEITVQQRNALTQRFKSLASAWWHWIDNAWLILDKNDQLTCRSLRNIVTATAPGVNTLVLQITPTTWSGFGPSNPQSNMFTWLSDTWNPHPT